MKAAATVVDRDVCVRGHRLRVRELGTRGVEATRAPVLVFLHEGLGCIEMWRDVPQQLAAATGLAAMIYDRRGYGRSESLSSVAPEAFLEHEARELLPALLEACAIVDPILIGHSDGGSIALLYAAGHDPLAVVTEAAHVFVEEITQEAIRVAVEAYDRGELRLGLQRYHGDNTEPMFRRWTNTWLTEEFARWNIESVLPAVSCPALIIQGQDDEYGTERQVEAIAAGVSGPAQVLWLPDCGHVPHQHAREAVLAAITRFVRDVCAQSREA